MSNVAIIGGGLAGLSTAIQLVKNGVEVSLFEKKEYPFHRVCGEYISNETLPFLKRNQIFPAAFEPAKIQRLQLSSVHGKTAELPLDMGGFGISRYLFDNFLFERAKALGVNVHLKSEVDSIIFKDNRFQITSLQKQMEADVVIGSFGKRSKLDNSLKRNFIKKRSPYVGIKYHAKSDHPADLISLHNFRNGYCGVTTIEQGKTTICYLTHSDNLKVFKNISEMEHHILYENPLLKRIFQNAEFLFEKPEVISEISFEIKSPVESHILMCGDAGGMITPLCGNGMAMAFHSSQLVSELVIQFCQGKMSREDLESQYEKEWKRQFARRLWAGRQIQKLFGSQWASAFAVNTACYAKPIANFLISHSHGKPF